MRILCNLLVILLLAGCGLAARPEVAGIATVTPTTQVVPAATRAAPTATPLPTAMLLPSATPLPSVTAPPATAIPLSTLAPTTIPPTVTPTPGPVSGLTIPDLRARSYGGGSISIGEVYNRGIGYTSYRITYPASELQLTGLLHVPDGPGPFPVIIANRGYIAPERYQPGMDSRVFADLMAYNGFLVVAPDYRGYAGGDDGPNPFYTGYYADILHLIPLAQQLPMARPGNVGMWGHSRGASITVAALTISDQIAAAVVYAPAPADLAADYARRFTQSGGDPGTETWPFPPHENPAAYEQVSPINYLDGVNAPVMLHHGTGDVIVDASASVAIADALEAAGKEVTLYLYEGGGHTLMGEYHQLYATRTLEFFQMHLTGE
jgi:dienelactone hydrolase